MIMKFFHLFLLSFAAVVAQAKINVVATLPDFGSIAEAVGGEHVKVTTIARGTEDAHFVDARPSFIRVLNQADVLIEGGVDLEIGWLPPLVQAARNGKILANAPGHLVLGRFVELLDVPQGPIDRSMGDVHPSGNPHYWLDPVNGGIIARKIAETFANVDEGHAAEYAANARAFSEKLAEKMSEWEKKMEPFRGTKVITYHKSYDYFARRFGLEIVGQLEPRPGLEPSASHITSLVRRAQEEGVKLVLIEPFRPRRTAEHAASAMSAKLLILPEKVGATKKARDYFSLFDEEISIIAAALAPIK
jgi:zinc/manganese transport system substrate-binding protein